jgi:carbamoyltransferase
MAPRGFRSFAAAFPVWSREKLFQREMLSDELARHMPGVNIDKKLMFTEHHQSHAASAFYPSPFKTAAILTMDGVGEWTTTSAGLGEDNSIKIHREIHFHCSLLYRPSHALLGFKVNSGEYKVMGPRPRRAEVRQADPRQSDRDQAGRLVPPQPRVFQCTGLRMTNAKFDKLFRPPRSPEKRGRARDGYRRIDPVINSKLVIHVVKSFGVRNLCLASVFALNWGPAKRAPRSSSVIQPAAGVRAGPWCALAAYHLYLGKPRNGHNSLNGSNGLDGMSGSLLGPAFDQDEIEERLHAAGARYEVLEEDALIAATADALVAQKAVGWFQGRMEFGPRALGSRSILGDPRAPDMQKHLNLKIKFRESFRPFAPSVRYEDVAEWFELGEASPYMLLVADVAEKRRLAMTEAQKALFGIDKLNVPRSEIPAVTHVFTGARADGYRETNPRFPSC